MMLILLSWKNIWRNPWRSGVVIMAFTAGIFAGVFTIALMNGMVKQRIDAITGTETGHIQVHAPGFRENMDINLLLGNCSRYDSLSVKIQGIKGKSCRLVMGAMAATAQANTGVKLLAVHPGDEKNVSNLCLRLIEGNYFEDGKENRIVIGRKLAKKLKTGIKGKIIITMQDINGDIVSGAFRVGGIFETDNANYDEYNVIAQFNDIQILTGILPGFCHEVVLTVLHPEETEKIKNQLAARFPDAEVMDWLSLSPEAGYLVSAMDQYMYIFLIIILLALCFGIINTMLMAVLERIREIAMLLALGMQRRKIFYMIVLETFFLAITGGAAGMAAGYFVSVYTGIHGIDFSIWKEAYYELGYASVIYPAIDLKTLIISSLLIMLTGFLSSLYPSVKATRIDMIKAIRTE